MNSKLSLINYEGDCLRAEKIVNCIHIYDKWNRRVELLDKKTFMEFINGNMTIKDSQGRRWNFVNEHSKSKPSPEAIKNFLKSIDDENLTLDDVIIKFGKEKVRPIFPIKIGNNLYQVYSIEGYEHRLGKDNGHPDTWWLDYSERKDDGFALTNIRPLVPYIDNGVHRICWGVNYQQFNNSKYKWDEWRFSSGGICKITANGKEVYQFYYRDLNGALAQAQVMIDKMMDHPFDFINPEKENDRKIWYYGLPAKISLGYVVGEIKIHPDYEYMTPDKWWDELEKRRSNIYPKKPNFIDDEEDEMKLDKERFNDSRDYGKINHGSVFYDGMINWFRK